MVLSKSLPTSPRKTRKKFKSNKTTLNSGICSPNKTLEDSSDFSSYGIGGRLPSLPLPRRDAKILEGMIRRRREEEMQKELAERFSELWRKDAEEKKKMERQTAAEYERYLEERRESHRLATAQRQLSRDIRQHMECGEMARRVRERQERSAHVAELVENEKILEKHIRSVSEQARYFRAAQRRFDKLSADEARRRGEEAERTRREEHARARRSLMIREYAQRTAISNRLSRLESWRLQREAAVADALRAEEVRARVREHDERARAIARARREQVSLSRARAAYTAALRDAVR